MEALASGERMKLRRLVVLRAIDKLDRLGKMVLRNCLAKAAKMKSAISQKALDLMTADKFAFDLQC